MRPDVGCFLPRSSRGLLSKSLNLPWTWAKTGVLESTLANLCPRPRTQAYLLPSKHLPEMQLLIASVCKQVIIYFIINCLLLITNSNCFQSYNELQFNYNFEQTIFNYFRIANKKEPKTDIEHD